MGKKTKTSIRQPVPAEPVPVQTPGKWLKFYPFIITGVFFILSLIGILHHEMWRDEYQAWMVAADAHTLSDLFVNLKYEGHPFLWHLFLFIISKFTSDPFWMQLLHILISGAFIFLINRYAPFTIIQKVLLTFGYYTFFEYNLISRSYGLVLLLIMIFCVLYSNRQKNIIWMAIVVFLMSNISIFGVMLTVCLSGILLLDQLTLPKKSKSRKIPLPKLAIYAGVTMLGLVIGYLQIRPEPDNSFPTFYVTDLDMVRIKWALSRLVHAYFPIPDFSNFHFWNTNFFVPDERKFAAGITPLLFLIWVIAFLRNRLVLLLYCGGTLLLLGFFYYTGFIWARYAGHLFILLIACYWMLIYFKEKPFENKWLNRLSILGSRIRAPFFLLILAVSAVGGVIAYIKDLKHPFSTSGQVSQYIRDHHLENYELIGSRDYAVSPIASQLNKEIFYTQRNKPGTFIIYDSLRANFWSFKDVQATINEKWIRDRQPILLLKDTPLRMTFNDTGQSIEWDKGTLNDSLSMKLLIKIPPGIVQDEEYYVYIIDRTSAL